MTQTHYRRDLIYSAIVDAKERDPIVIASDANRATVPLGRGFALWNRMNPHQQLVWVDDVDGNPRALTPKQALVLAAALELQGNNQGVTMRDLARTLRVAPSTVSRALTKLASWGLIAYVVGRGRWAGLVIWRAVKGVDDRYRESARARVRRWSEAVRRRISRLEINVAPYFHGRGRDSLTDYLGTTNTQSATLKRAWQWDEIEDALRD